MRAIRPWRSACSVSRSWARFGALDLGSCCPSDTFLVRSFWTTVRHGSFKLGASMSVETHPLFLGAAPPITGKLA